VAVLKLRLAIIDNVGCAGFEFFLNSCEIQRLGRKNRTYCGGVEDFRKFFIICIWNSETGNGKKVLRA
jgi:hypothetical protein